MKSLPESKATGACAYIVGANDKNIESICISLDVESLHFYDMRVTELLPIKSVHKLKHLDIRRNTKELNTAPIGEIKSLKTLILEDTPKIESLEPLGQLHHLENFEFSGGIWSNPGRMDVALISICFMEG